MSRAAKVFASYIALTGAVLAGGEIANAVSGQPVNKPAAAIEAAGTGAALAVRQALGRGD
jgi:hypothetical protein